MSAPAHVLPVRVLKLPSEGAFVMSAPKVILDGLVVADMSEGPWRALQSHPAGILPRFPGHRHSPFAFTTSPTAKGGDSDG